MVEQDMGHEDQALTPGLSLANHTISETSSLPFQSNVSYTSDQNGFEDSPTELNYQEGGPGLPFSLPSLSRVSSEETQALRTRTNKCSSQA